MFVCHRTAGGMDIHVLIDALASIMAMEDKEFCKVGELAMAVMIETATIIVGDHHKVSKRFPKPFINDVQIKHGFS